VWTVPRDWAGETVVILAGGPSVLDQDLSLLKGRRVIAINSAEDSTRRPTCCSSPIPMVDAFHPEPAFGGLIVTTCAWSDKRIKNLKKVAQARDFHQALTHWRWPRRVSPAPSIWRCISGRRPRHPARRRWADRSGGVGTTMARCLSLARSKGSFDRHAAEFKAWRRRSHSGVEVINCSPVSHVDLWPKMTLQEAVKEPMLQRVSKPSISVLSMYGMGDCIVSARLCAN
jgi:hypothetical protein